MPDVLVCNEIAGTSATNADFILSNVLNTDGVNYYQKASYSNNGSNLVNMMYYNGNTLALKSQDVISKDLNNNNLVRVIDIYKLYYKDPLLTAQSDTVFFYVIAAHLKAGSASADLAERTDATAAVMQYIKTRISNKNIVLCGDLNIYKSQEAAYQNLTQNSHVASRLYDPVNQPGNWSANSTFAALHTQSTRSTQTNGGCFSSGGLDDRLDHILISNEVRDNDLGMQYINNTYFALGNDGNHFNQDIKNGTNNSVPANVLNALYDMSDHLPVIAEFALHKNTVGIAEFSAPDVRINNPVSDILQAEIYGKANLFPSYRILNLTGKVVLTGSYVQNNTSWQATIDVSKLPNGIYLFETKTRSGAIAVKKVIVQ